jgi:hypothetical protein
MSTKVHLSHATVAWMKNIRDLLAFPVLSSPMPKMYTSSALPSPTVATLALNTETTQNTPDPQIVQEASISKWRFNPFQSITTFTLFEALPTELQVQIIKHAWNDAIHASQRHIHATSIPPILSRPTLSQHYKTRQTGTGTLGFSLVSKFFHAECNLLAQPHLIHLPVSPSDEHGTKPIIFIPDTDVLHIYIAKALPFIHNIALAFSSLPPPLRAVVKHVDICYTSTWAPPSHISRARFLEDLRGRIDGLDATLLENLTVSVRAPSCKTCRGAGCPMHEVRVP